MTRLVVSGPASEFIDEQGGRLYVWVRRARCCGGLMTLATATERPPAIEFRRAADGIGFELFLPARLAAPPDELHLELKRFPRRVEAYWDGCAWIA